MIDEVKKTFTDKGKKSLAAFDDNLKKVRTGRASPNILDSVTVDYYGTETPLNQVASVNVPEARMIVIQPWEKNMIPKIEKAIQKAELGLNPSNDGNVVRVMIPALTEETRKELVKNAKQIAEQARVGIRNIRRDLNEKLKKALKAHDITEDVEKQGLDEVQKLTDKYIKEIDEHLANKEKEILEI
ncbi:MAG: ribosome recycling factor [Spirochaetes bacterium]|nr:ribosome recycling factor [Spirochaetota bacterium]